MKMLKSVIFSLFVLAMPSIASADGLSLESGYTINSFDSNNKGPLGTDFKKFVSTGNEQYLRIGYNKAALDCGLELRTKEGNTQEASFYGRAVFGQSNTKFFFGGHLGVGKDTGVEGQSFNVNLTNLSGNTVAVQVESATAPKYTVAGAEIGVIQKITEHFGVVVKGEVQTKSYKLDIRPTDPNVQSTLDPMSYLAVEEAKRFETEVMEWKAGLALKYTF